MALGVPVTIRSASGSESSRKRLFFYRVRGRSRISRLLGRGGWGAALGKGNDLLWSASPQEK